MFINNFSSSWRSCFTLLTLSVTMALTGCNNMPSFDAPDTKPIHTPTNHQTSGNNVFTNCPPYNPEQTICNAQYDPVCVKIKNGSTISYRTAGNACSACGMSSAIGYTKGACN